MIVGAYEYMPPYFVFRMRKYFFLLLISVGLNCTAQTKQQLRDSLKNASNELSFHPDSIDLRLKKAGWNIQLEEWRKAKDEYDIVLKTHPTNIAALYFRAFVNEKLGRYNFARLDYENLLLLVPGNFEGQLGLALLNQKDKHYTEAYDQLNRLCNQFPDSAVAYAARAGMELERNMLELAEYDYSEALKRDPQQTDYLLNRVEIRLRLGKHKEAREDLDSLLALGISKGELREYYKRIKRSEK